MADLNIEYKTVKEVSGPLLMVEKVKEIAYGEVVKIKGPDGKERLGQVLEARENIAVIQVFEGTQGLDTKNTSIKFLGETMKIGVSDEMLGRVFNGVGKPIDDGPEIISKDRRDINGLPMNPAAREYPREFIQTGISTIDGMNTLVRGQTLPIFSGSGLPHAELI